MRVSEWLQTARAVILGAFELSMRSALAVTGE